MEIDCDPLPPRCSVPTRRPSWRTKRRVPRQYLARSASDLAPLIGHRRLRRLRQPFASPEGKGLEPRRGQSSCQSSGIGEPLTINRQLSGWNLPPLAIRAFGAHCIIWARSFSTTTSNASAETQHLQRFPTLSNVQPSKLGAIVWHPCCVRDRTGRHFPAPPGRDPAAVPQQAAGHRDLTAIEHDISAYLITVTIMNTAVGLATELVMWLCGLGDPIRNRGKFPGEWGSQGFENMIQAGDDNWHP